MILICVLHNKKYLQKSYGKYEQSYNLNSHSSQHNFFHPFGDLHTKFDIPVK